MSETIPPALAGERIDRVVSLLSGCSRAEASAIVSGGWVAVDGVVVTNRSQRVTEGAVVDLDPAGLPVAEVLEPDASVELVVVHEDAAVVVIDKPAGLVVHPGAGHQTGTLVHGLLDRFPELAGVGEPDRPGIVHRLDQNTSGLLVVARTDAAYASLVEQLQDRTVTRLYRALAWGPFSESSGVIDAPIGRSRRHHTAMAVSSRGREARTWYEVDASFTDPVEVTLLRCRLETGRTHQIRVHLSAIEHPVVGDAQYGGARQSLALSRPWLHAEELAFVHPVSGEDLTFRSAIPAELAEVLERLQ